MSFLRSIYLLAFSANSKVKRLVQYWAISTTLFVLSAGVLWFEVEEGVVAVHHAICLSVFLLGGAGAFYGLIRTSAATGITPSQLAFAQGVHAVTSITAGYMVVTPVRGAVLTLLLVVLVFCAFALESYRSYQINAFAVVLLGAAMWWGVRFDPLKYPPSVEAVHFILASSMMMAMVFLTSQFNWMRNRLKVQKAELEKQRNDLGIALSQIQSIAMRDDLTGLPNRRHMKEVLAEEEKRHRKQPAALCLALLDIDHFKSINDTYGHAAGDEILRSFAQQLRFLLRTDDVLARWGGEEFLLLLPNTEQEDAILVLDRLKHHLSAVRVETLGANLPISFSSGVAVMNEREAIVDTIRRADKAMFRAKSLGRNRNCLYDPEMEASILAREQLKATLAQAVATGQLLLHYQPQVTAGGCTTGAEVLVRCKHPERGLIYPGEFIPLAEESDMIIDLGRWVLREACKQLAIWAGQETMAHLSLSVNVSARQLRDPDFVPHTLALLEQTGADPRKLKLELTESILVDDFDAAISKMNQLRGVGVRFSLDDFGTGYSSLSYLKQLPLDQIKIDRAFVRDIVAGDKDGIIARAIIGLSHSLGCQVLAEGVETAMQKDFLDRYGCHDFQGYLFGRPVPLDVFEELFCAVASSSIEANREVV
jgi:diguanylate cyclase (GGDEF)-like protein